MVSVRGLFCRSGLDGESCGNSGRWCIGLPSSWVLSGVHIQLSPSPLLPPCPFGFMTPTSPPASSSSSALPRATIVLVIALLQLCAAAPHVPSSAPLVLTMAKAGETVVCQVEGNSVICNGTRYSLLEEDEFPTPRFWVDLGVSVVLVLVSGLMSGLTIGLMSINFLHLQILANGGGTKKEQGYGTDHRTCMC